MLVCLGLKSSTKVVPARYGNFTGGGVQYQTKPIGVTPENFYQIQTTSPFNGFHHNLGVLYFSRALATRSRVVNDTSISTMLFGMSFQGNYKFQADPSPSAINPFVLTEQTMENIRQNPLVSSEAIGDYVPSATFIREDDLVNREARPNARRHDVGGRLKLSYAPNDRFTIDLINSFDITNRSIVSGQFCSNE